MSEHEKSPSRGYGQDLGSSVVRVPFDLVWSYKERDWRWLWLRKRTVQKQEPLTYHDMSRITAMSPMAPSFAALLEKQGQEQVVDWLEQDQ